MKDALSFDDVLISPKFNDIASRDDVDVTTRLGLDGLPGPIVAANMPSVCETSMVNTVNDYGIGILHRMCSIEEQVDMVRNAYEHARVGAAIGIGKDRLERAQALVDAGVLVLCIDVAHGHQKRVLETAKEMLEHFPRITLIVGNIATRSAANYFSQQIRREYHYRVVLKVGVGGGSLCTTRVMTGCGVPTFQSLLDVKRALESTSSDMGILADGGIRNSGDIVKCLAAGANAVMLGSLLAGTDESPGPVFADGGKLVKVYRGSASYGAKKEYYGRAEYVEGAERLVSYKGSADSVCARLLDGVRSGMTYVGAATIIELYAKSTFIRISSAGYKESVPHGLYQ